jgi:acid phosphatase type 7
LTWQQSPSTTMTIQWISPFQEKQSVVVYRPRQSEQEWQKATGEILGFPQASQYLIHRVELKNLQPNTEYVFKIVPYIEEYRFLTAPARLEKELRFVVGGDMYHDDIPTLVKTSQKAALTSPLFGLIGGDIAYAVKSRSFGLQLIDRWMDWIKVWHKYMVTPQGNLIPVISAIGNHDLNGGFDQTPAQAAVFSALFPMPGKRIYNVLDFDPYLSIFILDSGHANSIAGQQTDWLRTVLNERQQVIHRVAIYHVPAYPSIRDFKNKYSIDIRNCWVPLFEQGGVQVAFEHHDHAYKRTHPLLKGRVHPEGIVYLGDGGWGVDKPRKLKGKPPYLAKFASARHFIAVTLTPSQQQFKCINDQGQVLDEYVQSVNQRKPIKENVKEKEGELLLNRT